MIRFVRLLAYAASTDAVGHTIHLASALFITTGIVMARRFQAGHTSLVASSAVTVRMQGLGFAKSTTSDSRGTALRTAARQFGIAAF